MGKGIMLILAVIVLAGCGSSNQTGDAATCLKNALANQALGGGNNCTDSMAASIQDQGSGTKINVSCTHQDANQYICDVKVPTDAGINLTGVQGGFYAVTYDGKSIVYQPQ